MIDEEKTVLEYSTTDDESDSDFILEEEDHDDDASSTSSIDDDVDKEEIAAMDELETKGLIDRLNEETSDDDDMWEDTEERKEWIDTVKEANETWKQNYGDSIDADSFPHCKTRLLLPPKGSPWSLAFGTTILLGVFAYELMAAIEDMAGTSF